MASYESDSMENLSHKTHSPSLEALYSAYSEDERMFSEAATLPLQTIEGIFNTPETHTVAFSVHGVTDLHLLYGEKNVANGSELQPVQADQNQEEIEQGLRNILSKLHTVTPGSTFLIIQEHNGNRDGTNISSLKHIMRMDYDYYTELQTTLEEGLDELGWNVNTCKRRLESLYIDPVMMGTEKKLPCLNIGVSRPDGSTEHSLYVQDGVAGHPDAPRPLRLQSFFDLIGQFEHDQPTREKYGRLLTNRHEVWDLAAGGDSNALERVSEIFSNIAWWSYMLEAVDNPLMQENFVGEVKDERSTYLVEGAFPPVAFQDLMEHSLHDWILETSHLTIGSIQKIVHSLSRPPAERLNIVKDIHAEEKIRFQTLPASITALIERTALYILTPEHTIPLLMRAIQYNRHVNKVCLYYKNRIETETTGRYWWNPNNPVQLLPDNNEQEEPLNEEAWKQENISIADRWRQAYAIMDEVKDIGTVPDTAEESVKRTILREMCRILGYPIPPESLKFAKNKLINAIGCTRMPKSLADYRMFSPHEYSQLRLHAETELMKGRKVILRLFDDSGEKGGGYPVALITSLDDLQKITEDEGAIDIETDDHGSLFVNVFASVQSVSRLRSIVHPVHEIDKRYAQSINNISDKIGLGGGGRLQLDGLRLDDGKLVCDFSAILMYNEAIARDTSLGSERAQKAPRIELSFSATYDKGVLIPETFPESLEDALKEHDPIVFSRHLLGSLFKRDGAAYAKLFGGLLFADQRLGMHSVELAFATIPVTENTGRSSTPRLFIETIDFDGLDTLPKWLQDRTATLTQAVRIARSYEVGRIRSLTEHWMNDLFELRHTAALAKYSTRP